MSAISTYLQKILTERWARNVRQAIHDAISQCYNDVNAPALQTEAMEAAVQAKIDAGEMAALTIADGTLTGAKLADSTIPTAKIADGAITMDKLSDDIDLDVETDTTLTQPGVPADAEAVGLALAEAGGGLTEEIAVALLTCFQKVAWNNPNGQEYYDDLLSALVGGANYFKVTSNLTHVKISNKTPYVIAGESYTATLTADAGYTIGSSSVTHGRTAVTVTNNTFTIPSVSGDIVITASATQTVDLPMLHYWDLTRNLNDSVGKKVVTLGGAYRNATGLTIASANQYADFPDVWGANRTIEIDVSSYVRGGTGHGRLFTYRGFSGSSIFRGNGFIFRNTGKWSFYKGSWVDFDNTDPTYISGKTVKFEIDSSLNVSVYVDNVLLGTVQSISFNRNDYTMGFGSESNSGYTCTITGVRVYEGVES